MPLRFETQVSYSYNWMVIAAWDAHSKTWTSLQCREWPELQKTQGAELYAKWAAWASACCGYSISRGYCGDVYSCRCIVTSGRINNILSALKENLFHHTLSKSKTLLFATPWQGWLWKVYGKTWGLRVRKDSSNHLLCLCPCRLW